MGAVDVYVLTLSDWDGDSVKGVYVSLEAAQGAQGGDWFKPFDDRDIWWMGEYAIERFELRDLVDNAKGSL